MKKNAKTKNELLQELNALKQEHEALKTIFEKNTIKHKRAESEPEHIESNVSKLFNTADEVIKQDDKQYIRKLFNDYIQMYASRDDRLTTYFSEDFSGFTGGGDFLVKRKEEWIDITRQDFAQVKDPIRIEHKDLALQALSKDIVVTTGFFTIHLPIKDHILSRETARLVLIFRKESEAWKICHSSISIPYYLVREGEVYPLKELVDRNQYLEKVVAERTNQLSEANDNLQHANEKLEREIAEHKKVGDALQQSNQKLEAIISILPDGIGMISIDGKIQRISEKLVTMHGYKIEEVDEFLGSAVTDFIDPSSHKSLINNIRKLLAGERDQKLTEYLAIKKDKSRFNIDVNSSILLDSNGNPESILYVERDITERKQAEGALQQSNQKLAAIISASPDGIGMISLDGKIQLMSDRLAEMYGYSIEQKNEIIGKPSIDFIDPSNHQLLIDNIHKLLTGLRDHNITEYLAIKKDNSRFYVEVNSTVLIDSNGNPESILFVERDVTERKRNELIIQQQYSQLQELNSTKDKFFSIIAHDLRSPFQSLLGSSELLATEIETISHEEIISFNKGLNENLKNLYGLLENLLNWSMMQRNMLDYKPVKINLNDFVNKIIGILNQIAVKKNISIINNVDEETFISADIDMLRSVIQNLIVNAIKFTAAEGQITISSIEKEDFNEVSVQDTGVGIEPDKTLKLFNFNTLFTTQGTNGEKGTGLGLSLCKEFIERNGGKIWVDSEVGKGSKFSFTLRKAT